MTCSETKEPVQLELFNVLTIYYGDKNGLVYWLGISEEGELFWTAREEKAFRSSDKGLMAFIKNAAQERYSNSFSILGLPSLIPHLDEKPFHT